MRVLIIEDEPQLLNTLAEALREEGYAVDEAADGEDGLAKAKMWDYDAIVLDVMLPKISGFVVLERLRLHKKTPVLMLTMPHLKSAASWKAVPHSHCASLPFCHES
jgi:two-component system OmpR family response regulator